MNTTNGCLFLIPLVQKKGTSQSGQVAHTLTESRNPRRLSSCWGVTSRVFKGRLYIEETQPSGMNREMRSEPVNVAW